ncbi:hypothetical protein Ade02nite_71690 [Paractinoplanes deccanensis]|uniref:Uncharacterized protein n=1 Tax=Paractinoplanes deccanensis TaxID=113561 RepID=A0ABQ3YEV4_9ACTN|nr:hypothetical protein [Actinoplanes deccanensis]GID78528.1 hypothetical protein Ade02nite_71690 [Actinoplanes deccanensis]
MSPSGVAPTWRSESYFDNDSDPPDITAAVEKCAATAEQSEEELSKHSVALCRAATRLEVERTDNQALIDARQQLREAATAVERACELLQDAQANSTTFLSGR